MSGLIKIILDMKYKVLLSLFIKTLFLGAEFKMKEMNVASSTLTLPAGQY